MGTVYRPSVTRPLPAGARIMTRKGNRQAEWIDGDGRKQSAPMTGWRAKRPGIVVKSGTYVAKYRDGDGLLQTVSTGCTDKTAARSVLASLESRAEKVRSGIITTDEARVADHAHEMIDEAVDAYLAALAVQKGKGDRPNVSPLHVKNVGHALRELIEECGFRRLRDVNRATVERWTSRKAALPDGERPAARTINTRLVALTAFMTWCKANGRIASNPVEKLEKRDEKSDCRRKRRAMTADEIARLLAVARLRPVAEYGRDTERTGEPAKTAKSRATWRRAPLTLDTTEAAAERGRETLRPEIAERLGREGRERATVYLTLLATGLRRGELASIRVGDVTLDTDRPTIDLRAVEAKNGKAATIPLRSDVADELRARLRERAEAAGGIAPKPDDALLYVPAKLIRILDRDLAAAGIAKRDAKGRTLDVHAMRGTLATHLARAGVPVVTLKTLMRHAKIETTLAHYTDETQLGIEAAVELLSVAPLVAPTLVQRSKSEGIPEQIDRNGTPAGKSKRGRKTRIEPRKSSMGDTGLEPVTPSLSS